MIHTLGPSDTEPAIFPFSLRYTEQYEESHCLKDFFFTQAQLHGMPGHGPYLRGGFRNLLYPLISLKLFVRTSVSWGAGNQKENLCFAIERRGQNPSFSEDDQGLSVDV